MLHKPLCVDSNASVLDRSFVCDCDDKSLEYPWTESRPHPAKKLKHYCSKIPNPTSGWYRATRYRENDIAFLIYTGAPFYLTRARAVRETWVSRVTNYYFLSSIPHPSLPVTVIHNTGEDYQSNIKKIFDGLKLIYENQQKEPASKRHKWYFLVGCDTYVNVPHLLKRLEAYDFTKPYFIGGCVGFHVCFHKNGTTYKSPFVGGNSAHVFSAALVEALYPHLSMYIESIWPKPNHSSAALSDVALSCLIFSLGYNMTIIPGFWRNTPDKIIKEFSLKEALAVQEPSSWHYIKPEEMMDLDEFYTYQYIDRLTHDHNVFKMDSFKLFRQITYIFYNFV
jgi:hypothetical protein